MSMMAKRTGGFTMIELLFVLALMATFTLCFASIKWHKEQESEELLKFVSEFSKAVYICRIKSISNEKPVTLKLENNNFVITYEDRNKVTKSINKPFRTDKITTHQFWKLPTRTDGYLAETQTTIPYAKFKDKFFVPFELEFKFNNGNDEVRKVITADRQCSLKLSNKLYKERQKK